MTNVVKIGGLGALGDWYKQQATAVEPEKTRISYIEEGLQFLEKNEATVIPVGEYDKYITVRDQWVFVRGWLGTEDDSSDKVQKKAFNKRLKSDDVAIRFLVNALSLRSRLLLLDPMSAQIFEYFRLGRSTQPHRIATADAFRLTLHILWLVNNGYMEPQSAINEGFLEETYRRVTDPNNAGSSDIFTVKEKTLATLNGLRTQIHDPYLVLPELVTDRWIIIAKPTYADDGWTHYLTAPSWMFGVSIDDENNLSFNQYEGRRVDNWGYYRLPLKKEVSEPNPSTFQI
jgi:hypothetical protein